VKEIFVYKMFFYTKISFTSEAIFCDYPVFIFMEVTP
jgi:hypothetical protein